MALNGNVNFFNMCCDSAMQKSDIISIFSEEGSMVVCLGQGIISILNYFIVFKTSVVMIQPKESQTDTIRFPTQRQVMLDDLFVVYQDDLLNNQSISPGIWRPLGVTVISEKKKNFCLTFDMLTPLFV